MEKRIQNIVDHAEVSEKSIERYLCDRVKAIGGLCLKYSNPSVVGYPDRLVMLPGGRSLWFELKSKGKHTQAIQEVRIKELRKLGQTVYVCDNKDDIDYLLRIEEMKISQL